LVQLWKVWQNSDFVGVYFLVYLFRHKMKCGYCGHPISSETGTARNGEIKRYYKCLGRKVYHNGCEQSVHSKEALEEAKIDNALDNLMSAIEQGIVSKTTKKRLTELEAQQEALECELLIEKSKTAVKVHESFIREYYEEALRLEVTMLVNMLVKEVVLYNDRIEVHFNTPLRNCPDESQGFSFYKGFISITAQTIELEMYAG